MEKEIERIIESAPDRNAAEIAIKKIRAEHQIKKAEAEKKEVALKEAEAKVIAELEQQRMKQRAVEESARVEALKAQELRYARELQLALVAQEEADKRKREELKREKNEEMKRERALIEAGKHLQ